MPRVVPRDPEAAARNRASGRFARRLAEHPEQVRAEFEAEERSRDPERFEANRHLKANEWYAAMALFGEMSHAEAAAAADAENIANGNALLSGPAVDGLS